MGIPPAHTRPASALHAHSQLSNVAADDVKGVVVGRAGGNFEGAGRRHKTVAGCNAWYGSGGRAKGRDDGRRCRLR